MGTSRPAGPLCSSMQAEPIDEGTVPRFVTSSPRPLCQESRSSAERTEFFMRLAAARQAVKNLLRLCQSPKRGLTDRDYEAEARSLGVDVPAIRAVAAVEAPRGAFDEHGRPVILFERHHFHRLTSGAHSRRHPGISSASAGGYGKFSAQYAKLEEAYGLDAPAALKAASWGRFQIMGSNFAEAGFSSVEEMVATMMQSERAQLGAFSRFIASDRRMLEALRKKDWAGFAARYNGPGYARNRYDERLSAEYQKLVGEEQSKHGVAQPVQGRTRP